VNEIVGRIARRAGVSPDQCRAVLQALRDPEPEMVDAGIDAAIVCRRSAEDAETCVWRAMVDCALDPDCRAWDVTGQPSPHP
jgi:hypothetical protein